LKTLNPKEKEVLQCIIDVMEQKMKENSACQSPISYRSYSSSSSKTQLKSSLKKKPVYDREDEDATPNLKVQFKLSA
jgi:hypothetical protein